MNVFFATLSPMMVMFICIVIGFILNKKKIVPENTATVLSKLENYVLVPALIINTFMNYCTVASVKEQYSLILFSVIALFIAILIAVPLSKVFTKEEYKRNIYKYALTFGNFGFMGNAIVPAILGDETLYFYMLFTLPLNIAVYTWGVMILVPKGETKTKWYKSLLNPIFISVIIGAFLGLSGLNKFVPGFLATSITNLSACMGPLAMVLTGFVVGDYNVLLLLKDKKVYVSTFLRLLVLPALFVTVLKLLGSDNLTLTLALFAFATPLGMNTVVFPAAYGGDTKTGASMAMISHTLCVITIPIMYALLSSVIA